MTRQPLALAHTYYLAQQDRVVGACASDPAVADALIGLWRAQTTPDRAEAARHEGISAWIDGATGTVQARRILLDASDRYEVTTVEPGALAAAMARHAPAAG